MWGRLSVRISSVYTPCILINTNSVSVYRKNTPSIGFTDPEWQPKPSTAYRIYFEFGLQAGAMFLAIWRFASGEWFTWWSSPWTLHHLLCVTYNSSLSCFAVAFMSMIYDYLLDAAGNPDVHLPGGPGSL